MIKQRTQLPRQGEVRRIEPSLGMYALPLLHEGKYGKRIAYVGMDLLPASTIAQHGADYDAKGGIRIRLNETPRALVSASLPVICDIFEAALEARGKNVVELRSFLQKYLRSLPIVQTMVVCSPRNIKREVVHFYGTEDERRIKCNIVGEGGIISEQLKKRQILALTRRTPREFQDLLDKINGTEDSLIFEQNDNLNSKIENVVRFIANSVRASLICNRDATDSWPALGVSIASAEGASVFGELGGLK